MNHLDGLALIVVGILCVAGRRRGARDVERFWGRGSRDSLRTYELGHSVVGIVFVILGAVRLFHRSL
jgi:hypothetical protein